MVGLVDDDQVRLEELKPTDDRLDAADLHGVSPIRRATGGNHAMIDPERVERSNGLVDQFLPVDEDQHSVSLPARSVGDVGEHHGLARSGRGDEQRRASAGTVGVADAVDAVALVVAEVDHFRVALTVSRRRSSFDERGSCFCFVHRHQVE